MSKVLKVFLAGGGTGGHIYPALSIAEALKKIEPSIQIEFVGTESGLETRIVPKAGYKLNLIQSGKLKLRVVHNDTKINNILFDTRSNKAVAVIDLDTLMPGYFIYDLGDIVRTFVSPVSEEETDLTKVAFRFPFYQKLLEGYLSEMDDCLTDDEKKAIPFAGLMMTYIMAIRFLADYLNGDIYYNTEYPGQNLVRASNQLRLLALIKQNVQPNLEDEENP